MDKRKKTKPFNYVEYLNHYCDLHKNNNIDLVYEGEITHDITRAFTSLIEESLERREELRKVKKKIFNVMVEALQNISKHADNLCNNIYNKLGKGIIIISNDPRQYIIVTGNIIENIKREPLQKAIDKVNGLPRHDLREMYKKQLSEGRLSEKGGAGLGFIDIARKSENTLQYEFFDVDQNFSFFVITVKVSKS
jgi:hypothetical protein